MILVVGATGELGGRVVHRLRARGEAVLCLVRRQTAGDHLEAMGARVVRGDLTDPPSLRAACVGVDTVVCTATVIARHLTGEGGPSLRDDGKRACASWNDAALIGAR